MKYKVCVDDNFHYMDEAERSDAGVYDTAEEALAAVKRIVDESLRWGYKAVMTPAELYEQYIGFGTDPFIVSDDPDCKFSAWDYAKERSAAICAERAASE